jgi:hypothetical protein
MALHQVSARIEGDIFQGMIFWWHAAMLLRPSSKVVRVTLENDKAADVDDVSIHYAAPGIDAGGRSCAADYYQVKYHVARSSEYAADSFCDPSFINATRSLLQRFHDARYRLGDADGWHRLHLISNRQWSAEDKLGPLLRLSDEGSLPDRFFIAGTLPGRRPRGRAAGRGALPGRLLRVRRGGGGLGCRVLRRAATALAVVAGC